MDIELCMYYNMVTIWFLFIIQSMNLPPSEHPVHILQQLLHIQCTLQHTATLCSLQPSSHYIFSAHTTAAIASSVHILQQHCIFSAHTTAAITSSVHTATMYSHVQLSAANFQCTLQPTAAIYNHLYYNYTIQCTLQLHYLMLIPYSASSEEG